MCDLAPIGRPAKPFPNAGREFGMIARSVATMDASVKDVSPAVDSDGKLLLIDQQKFEEKFNKRHFHLQHRLGGHTMMDF